MKEKNENNLKDTKKQSKKEQTKKEVKILLINLFIF